jgi:hypothetical protein
MKKIFKKLFSVDRIDLIKKNLKKKNPICMEIGGHRGEFSKELFLNFKPKKVVLVDPWMVFEELIYAKSWYGNSDKFGQKKQNQYCEEVKAFFAKEILNREVEVHRTTSDEYFKNNQYKFDLIYIDGNHLYDFVKKDISNSLDHIDDHGIIILDDYKFQGWWNDGVTRAIDYFVKAKKIKILNSHNFFNYHHQCILQKTSILR